DGYLAEFDLRRRFGSRRGDIARAIEADAKKQKKLTREQLEIARRNAALNYADARPQRAPAVQGLLEDLPKDPAAPPPRFALAEAYFDLTEVEPAGPAREARRQAGRAQALEAHRLDGLAGEPRSLSDRQRDQIRRWLGP